MTSLQTTQTAATSATAGPAGTACCGHHDAFAILHDCHEHILERLARLETLGRELCGSLGGAPGRAAGNASGNASGSAPGQAPGGPSGLTEHQLAVLADVLTFLDTAVPMHSADEEQTLFPRLRESVGPAAGHTPMDCMEEDHVQHKAMLAGLKRAVVRRDPLATGRAALAIVTEYRNHIGKEEEVLFPWARETLTGAAVVAAMTQEMRQRRAAAGMLTC